MMKPGALGPFYAPQPITDAEKVSIAGVVIEFEKRALWGYKAHIGHSSTILPNADPTPDQHFGGEPITGGGLTAQGAADQAARNFLVEAAKYGVAVHEPQKNGSTLVRVFKLQRDGELGYTEFTDSRNTAPRKETFFNTQRRI